MPEVTMPRLSDTMEEGTISRWLKHPGDAVQKGEVLAEIETDKANMDLEAYDAGVLEKILVQEGEVAPIGQAIAIIGTGKGAGQGTQAAGAPMQSTQPQQAQEKPQQAEKQEQQAPGAATTASSATTPADVVASREGTEQAPEPSTPVGHDGASRQAQTAEAEGVSIKASPLARRLAEEYNIDLRQVHGTGPGGRIVRDDIEDFREQQGAPAAAGRPAPATAASQEEAAPAAAAQATPTAPTPPPGEIPPDTEVVPLTRVQNLIARRLTESKQSIPHFYISNDVNMTEALALRQTLNASAGEEGVKVTVNDLIVKACALALEKFPEVNSSYRDGQLLRHKHIHIGIAVDVPSGLVVPVIHDANIKGVRSIAREAKGLIEKARNNKLSTADLTGGTFSVSNLGMMDVTEFIAVINPPEAAILAIGSTRKQFVPVNDQPVIQDIMPMTMSADHRILYGATVARFLQEVKRLLQNPYTLLG